MLSCLNVSLELENKLIFSKVNFTLLPGGIYLLKGSNGSGKTSLLKIIAGINKGFSGKILWNNKPIDHEEYCGNHIGYLGHENAIKGDLSIFDNLALWAKLKSTELLISPALAHFKLHDLIDEKCRNLSAGFLKRIALARVIISNTKLWLLDEPETNLDEEGRELLLKLLQVKTSSGGIILIASHNERFYQKIPIINLSDFRNV